MIEIFNLLINQLLTKTIVIGLVLSIIVMMLIQKIKMLSFIKTNNQIWFINFILSFGIGIPFSIFFYNSNIFNSFWISLFSFIFSPGIYFILKRQTIISYTPKSLDDKKINIIEIPKTNIIDRKIKK